MIRPDQHAAQIPEYEEKRLAAIIESAMDAIIGIDEQQRITLVNHAAEEMFRFTREQMLGQPLDMLIPIPYREVHRHHVEQFGQVGVTTRSMHNARVLMGRRSDGSEFPIEATIFQAQVDGEKVFAAIVRDVTARLEQEEQLSKQQQLIRQLSTPVLRVADRLLVAPLIGELNAQRARLFTERLLESIKQARARAVVVDLTGIAAIDAEAANHLVSTAQSALLLGAQIFFSGISKELSATLVNVRPETITSLKTSTDLQSAIEEANRAMTGVPRHK